MNNAISWLEIPVTKYGSHAQRAVRPLGYFFLGTGLVARRVVRNEERFSRFQIGSNEGD